MNFNAYQKAALSTAIYPDKVIYTALGLASEAGEVAGKVKKILRDRGGNFLGAEFREAVKDELGDVLWYVAALAADLGLKLDDIAQANLDKLADRVERGVIGGSGDDR